MSRVSPKEVRQARAFLQMRGFETSMMPPRLFAMTAKREGKTFGELLNLIARLKMGGQGLGQSPEAEQLA